MFTQKSQKSLSNFICEKCNYNTCKKTDFDKHLLTWKHKNHDIMFTNVDINATNVAEKKFTCECGKDYKHRQSLYVHKKTCNYENSKEEKTNNNHLVEYLMKENSEFKSLILEALKNGSVSNSNNIINNNSNNKSFNLQFFLNETCKDAMNITDFVDSIQLQLSDLEKVGELGYIEGISNIIVKNLNALDVTLRPVHCTDKKRETMYIKDENKWEKEDEKKAKLHKMVRKVAIKNINLISEFKELYPDWRKSTSKVSDQFNTIIIESMGGAGDNDFEKEEKIIKKIAKEVLIDSTFKSTFH
jgi:hypothetical protein